MSCVAHGGVMTIVDVQTALPSTGAHTTSARRRTVVYSVHLAAAVVDGVALSTIVLHATRHLGLLSGAIGVLLTVAGVAALVTAVPLGALADRLGLRTSAAVFGLGSAAALAGYALADTGLEYVTAAVCFAIAQAAAGAVRQALAVDGAESAARLCIRASMHTLLNIGFGLGTVLGGVVAVLGSSTAFRMAYAVAAMIAVLAAVATLTLPASAHRAADSAGILAALRDRRFATATVLASLIQLTMPVLSILIPVWVLTNTDAAQWLPSAALAVNTALVIAGQKRWSATVVNAITAARSAQIAAASLFLACALLAVPATAPWSAASLVIAAVIILTVGEIAGGAATWFVALQDVPEEAEGRYQSAFSMSSSAARILGPALALPLVTHGPIGGWIVLGIVLAAACLGVSVLAASQARPGALSRATHAR